MGKKKKKKTAKKPKQALRQSKPEKITNGLDPHLQELVLKARDGIEIDAIFGQSQTDGTVLVDVIAKLIEPSAEVDGLVVTCTIGNIVTGHVNLEEIEKVRSNENVASLKRSRSLRRELEFSVDEINASFPTDGLEVEEDVPTGKGVIVGIVDYGCDINHDNFRREDGTTRLLYFWDQVGGSSAQSPEGYGYGREFDSNAIDDALSSTNPYNRLRHNPGRGSHGTHVMDIAVGNGIGTGFPGVAPEADVIFVNIPSDGIEFEDDVEDDETYDLGNSKMLVEAVDYVFSKAEELGMPAVVNVSLSAQGGPHDGSTLVEEAFDVLLQNPGRAITIAAGNSHHLATHASGDVSENSSRIISWFVGEDDSTNNEIEVWYPGASELGVSLITPNGHKLPSVALGTTVTLKDDNGFSGRIIHRERDPNNGDNHIDVILHPRLPKGKWALELTSESDEPIEFHAWIELDPFGKQAKFDENDDDPSHTLGSISCGKSTIAVGSYLSGVADSEISVFSAEGPTRDGREKPEISAPGQFLNPFRSKGILAAKSKTQGSSRKSGTSMAAPHVAGVIALLMSASGRLLTNREIRTLVIESSRGQGSDWHSRYGFGRVDAAQALEGLRGIATPFASTTRRGIDRTAISDSSQTSLRELLELLTNVANDSNASVKMSIEAKPSKDSEI